MNVHHVRFCAAAVFAALVSGAAPLAAQSATQADARDALPALTAIGIVPTSLDSVTAVAAQPAADASSASTAVVARGPSVASARVASHAISTSRGAPPVGSVVPQTVLRTGTDRVASPPASSARKPEIQK